MVGFPKSGHTWMQYLLAGLVYGVNVRFAPDSLIQDLIPDRGFRKSYRRYGTPTVFKSHDLPGPDFRRVIYLVRDGRDAVVSYWHFLRATSRSEVSYQTVLDGRGGRMPTWEQHVEAWLANPFGAELMVLKYEDLHAEPARSLARVGEFLQIERPPEIIQAAIANAAFETMQKKEEREGWDNTRWPAQERFVRRGVVGSYQDEMPPPVLHAFLQQAAGTLEKLGYPLD